jgi:hypothetical protein
MDSTLRKLAQDIIRKTATLKMNDVPSMQAVEAHLEAAGIEVSPPNPIYRPDVPTDEMWVKHYLGQIRKLCHDRRIKQTLGYVNSGQRILASYRTRLLRCLAK